VTVKATFDNSDLALWPGQYLDVVITLSTVPNAVAVPSPAVQTGQNGTYAYVVTPERTVDLRPVIVAAVDGDRTALTAGLAAGERVVTEGQLRLTSGARVVEMPTSQEAGNPSDLETAAGAKATSKLP
jgi:multidrug efflux system membrane fusion protein